MIFLLCAAVYLAIGSLTVVALAFADRGLSVQFSWDLPTVVVIVLTWPVIVMAYPLAFLWKSSTRVRRALGEFIEGVAFEITDWHDRRGK